MILFLILFLLSFSIFVLLCFYSSNFHTHVMFFVTCIAVSLLIPHLIGTYNLEDNGQEVLESKSIISLHNEYSDKYEGNFLLGIGHIDSTSESIYYYGIQTEYGYKIESLNDKEVYIVEDGENKIEKIGDVKLCEKKWYQFSQKVIENTKYIIHVPKNTIITKFEIN